MDGLHTETMVKIAATVALLSIGFLMLRTRKRKAEEVRIKRIIVYPIKSCRGVSVLSTNYEKKGLKGDRNYMFVRESDGMFLSSRKYPHFFLLAPDIPTDDGILIRFNHTGKSSSVGDVNFSHFVKRPTNPKLIDVEIWDHKTQAEDQGDEIADIITKWMQSVNENFPKIRLVRQADHIERPTPTEGVPVNFADAYPMLLLSESSINYLNGLIGDELAQDRFRPNVVIEACSEWEEDEFTELYNDRDKFAFVKPCNRCVMPNIDPTKGEMPKTPYVTRILRKFRRATHLKKTMKHFEEFFKTADDKDVFVGQNIVSGNGSGILRVGEMLRVR